MFLSFHSRFLPGKWKNGKVNILYSCNYENLVKKKNAVCLLQLSDQAVNSRDFCSVGLALDPSGRRVNFIKGINPRFIHRIGLCLYRVVYIEVNYKSIRLLFLWNSVHPLLVHLIWLYSKSLWRSFIPTVFNLLYSAVYPGTKTFYLSKVVTSMDLLILFDTSS